MTDPGYYEQSIPPALLLGGRRRVAGRAPAGGGPAAAASAGAGTRDGGQPSSPRLAATAGTPGGYTPPVKAGQRPRNLTELAERVQPPDATPWGLGEYVPMGTSGKRAHWNGEEWRGGESPGYPATPVQEAPAVDLAAEPAVVEPVEGSDTTVTTGEDGMPVLHGGTPPPETTARHAAPLPPAPYSTQFPGDEQPGDLTR